MNRFKTVPATGVVVGAIAAAPLFVLAAPPAKSSAAKKAKQTPTGEVNPATLNESSSVKQSKAESSAQLYGHDFPPPDEKAAVQLNPNGTVFLDKKHQRLLAKTQVVLREGLLEMLICRAHTKEHESILSVDADAFVLHGGLLALGATAGAPVQFRPEFKPPQGQEIAIWVNWKDENGEPQRAPARNWVRHVTRRYYDEALEKLPKDLRLPEDGELRYDEKLKTLVWYGVMTVEQKVELTKLSKDVVYQNAVASFFEKSRPRPLEAAFVFAGSAFYQRKDGARVYQAEAGNIVCVANFSDAMIDLSVASSADNSSGLLFEPTTEAVPPMQTSVLVEFIPVPVKEPVKEATP